jgi:hypothetical protein
MSTSANNNRLTPGDREPMTRPTKCVHCGKALPPPPENARKFRRYCSYRCQPWYRRLLTGKGSGYRGPESAARTRKLQEAVANLRNRGKTYREIGEELGFTKQRAQQLFQKISKVSG